MNIKIDNNRCKNHNNNRHANYIIENNRQFSEYDFNIHKAEFYS